MLSGQNLNLATDFLNRGISLGENLVELYSLAETSWFSKNAFPRPFSITGISALDPVCRSVEQFGQLQALSSATGVREEELGKLLALQEKDKVGEKRYSN